MSFSSLNLRRSRSLGHTFDGSRCVKTKIPSTTIPSTTQPLLIRTVAARSADRSNRSNRPPPELASTPHPTVKAGLLLQVVRLVSSVPSTTHPSPPSPQLVPPRLRSPKREDQTLHRLLRPMKRCSRHPFRNIPHRRARQQVQAHQLSRRSSVSIFLISPHDERNLNYVGIISSSADKQCYVYIRTGHCAKGTLCR